VEQHFTSYERAFTADNRKGRTLAISLALLAITAIGFTLMTTLHELGSLNAHITGVFHETDRVASIERTKLKAQAAAKPEKQSRQEYPDLDAQANTD
jgi:sorbitol-specific phosphotransferase system component IIA